jgi:hypothetical protein
MKAKSFFSGVTLFVVGMIAMFGIEANARHHDFNHHFGISKRTVIEVGAPLTVNQLKHEGLM